MKNPFSGMQYVFGIKPEHQPDINNNPREGAGILFVNRYKNEILLLLRNDFDKENTWCIPGGGVNYGESILDAAIREVIEETQISPSNYKIKSETPIYSNKISDNFTFHTFLAYVSTNIEPQLNFEHRKWNWFNINELPRPLHPGVMRMFNDIGTAF